MSNNVRMEESQNKINPETVAEFRKLGLLNETGLRNYNIKREYEVMKKNGQGSVEAIEKLMNKYYRSWSVICGIVYNK